MTRLAWSLGTASLLILAGPVVVLAADPAALRWRLEKGRVLNYSLKHHEVRTVNVGDKEFVTTTDSDYDWRWTVQDVDDQGVATLEMKLGALRVRSTGKEFDFQYDSASANPSDDTYKKDLGSFYDQLRFGKHRLKLARDGRIVEVYGLDKLLAEVTPGTSVAEQHGLPLHDGSFRWYLQLLLGRLPEKPLTTGEKWQEPVRTTLTGLGELSGEDEHTVGKAEGDVQQLKQTGKQSLALDMSFGASTLRGTLATSKVTATVRFAPKGGMVKDSSAETDFGGDLKLGINDQPIVLKVTLQHKLELHLEP